MKHSQIIILTILLLLIVVAILLNLLNILMIDPRELFGYGLIFYGIATVYTTFGEGNKLLIFIGAALFLTGIVISMPVHFDFVRPLNLVVPASMLIAGISLFMAYFDEVKNKSILIASVILTAAGIIFIMISRSIQLSIFGESILKIIEVYWPVLIIISGITIILKR